MRDILVCTRWPLAFIPGVKIRKRKNRRKGSYSWQLDCGRINGKHLRLSFATREAAEAERVERERTMKRGGALAFDLSDAERLAFQSARDELRALGVTVKDAVEFYVKHAKPVAEPVKFEMLQKLCRDAKEDEGKSAVYLRQLKSVGSAFGRAGHALRFCHEITQEDVRAWLRANKWAPATWNNYLTDLQTIFEWGKTRGYLTINPCAGIERKQTHDGEIKFLTVDECSRLLARAAADKSEHGRTKEGKRKCDAQGRWIPMAAAEENFLDFIPYLVIGLFCGPRPDKELGGMPCSDIKLDAGHEMIVITAGRAKSRRRRTVDLPVNAVAWLQWAQEHAGWKMEGNLLPRNFKKRWKRLREQCGLFESWPHDAMRHTFATYEYALEQNEAKLQVKLAHRSAQMLHAHYRGLTTPQEAGRFRRLVPPE